MTDLLNTVPVPEPGPQLVELLYECGAGAPTRYLRPIETGTAYYDLSRVERAVDPAVESEEDLLAGPERRTWETLGPVYLLAHTLQTLRWSSSPEPGTYHVGRVPDAAAYRFAGESAEYPFSILVELLEQGPAAFRGYPVPGSGGAHRLQFTPPAPGETGSESNEWASVGKWLSPGREQVRDEVHYQRYDEVNEAGAPLGHCFIGQLTAEGEWLSPAGGLENVARWLRRPGAATGAHF